MAPSANVVSSLGPLTSPKPAMETASPSSPISLNSPMSMSSPKTFRSGGSKKPAKAPPRGEIDWENHVFVEAEEPPHEFLGSGSGFTSRAQSRMGNRATRTGKSGQLRRYATVEECPLPAVPTAPEQQLALPCNAQIAQTLRVPVDEFEVRFEAPRAKAAWKQWALSPTCVEMFRDTFWWVLVEEFKKHVPDGPRLQAFLFDRVANNYTKLLLPDGDKQTPPNDGYLEILTLVQAQGLLRAFQIAFPKSKHKFNEAFYRRILRHVTQWTVVTPRTKHALRDVSHRESGFVGRLADSNELRQDFGYDASMSAKAIEQWRATYLPPAHDFCNRDRHSLLVAHFLTSHGILDSHPSCEGVKNRRKDHVGGSQSGGPERNDHVGDVKSLKDGHVSSANWPHGAGGDARVVRGVIQGSVNKESVEKTNTVGNARSDAGSKSVEASGKGTSLSRGNAKNGALKPERQSLTELGVDVAPHLRPAVSALLAAGLAAQEAVAVASFMYSGDDDADDITEGLGFGDGDVGPPGASGRDDAHRVSYASMAADSFDRTRHALERYADVRRRGLASVGVTQKETAHLLQELRHLWSHVGRRDLRYMSNSLANWDLKPVVLGSARDKELERASAEVKKEVAGALARSAHARAETDKFLKGSGQGNSRKGAAYGRWRARFDKGEAEQVLEV